MQDDESFDSKQVLLMVTTNCDQESSYWYLNTGCYNHMTGNRDWLIDLDSSVKSSVIFAYDIIILVEGIGKVLIIRKDRKKCLYV